MTNRLIPLLLSIFLTLFGSAQEVGKMDFKIEGFTQKKFNNTSKKIFIQYFTVNYQKVMISYATAKGGRSYGGATAGLALGLDGVTDDMLQAMTDRYYQKFVDQLKEGGFEIMSADEVKAVEYFSSWEKIEGSKPVMDLFGKGYLTTSPSNGTFLNGGGGAFNLAGQPESSELDGAIVARVSITVPFAESQSINGGPVGGVANITAKADLRVSPGETLPQEGDFSKPVNLDTDVTFAYKKSLKWQALFRGKLNKPIEIEEVLDEDTKYKSTSVGTSGRGFSTKYSEAYAENAQLIDCDPKKYEAGVDEAINTYLDSSVNGFLSFLK